MERLTKLTVTLALTIALGTVTGAYVINFLTPALMLWLLYFVISNQLINTYLKIKSDEGRKHWNKH